MTRFDIIQQFKGDKRTNRDHLVVFQVLTELWVNEGKPPSFAPVMNELVSILKARPGNVYRWLSDLDKFGFIEYRRGRNQHEVSTILFKSATIPTVVVDIPNRTAEPQMKQQTRSACTPNETATRFGRPADSTKPVSQLKQRGLNETASYELSTEEMAIQANGSNMTVDNVDNSDLVQPLPVHNDNLSDDSRSILESKEVDSSRVKGVQGKRQNRAVARARKSTTQPGCKFVDSPLADIVRFREAFATDSTAKTADLDYYYQKVLNWRDREGAEPQRPDWKATTKTFMLNDYKDGKLVTTIKPLNSNANPRNNVRNFGPIIQPVESDAPRRFGSF